MVLQPTSERVEENLPIDGRLLQTAKAAENLYLGEQFCQPIGLVHGGIFFGKLLVD